MKKAKWIWLPGKAQADSYGEFYQSFQWEQGQALCRISCDGDYTLYVTEVDKNGKPVVDENGKPTGERTKDPTEEDKDEGNAYHLLPGQTYTKDPTIHVSDDSEGCYLFVKVENGIKNIEGGKTIATQMAELRWKPIA